jgi:uncharacterized protein (DUF1684 family)
MVWLLILFALTSHAEDKSYAKEIADFHQEYESSIRNDTGPLLLVSRVELPEGETVVQLRPGRRFGTVRRNGRTATFTPEPGVAITYGGQPVSGPVRLQMGTRPDLFTVGSTGFTASEIGGKYFVSIRDTESEYRKQFHGLQWFPVDPSYRVKGKYTAYKESKIVPVPDTTGGTRQMKAPGQIAFTLRGKSFTLEPLESGSDEWMIMFRDSTAGQTTYGGGRFLEVSPTKNGAVVLDFNKAYNPYCAYNPYISCPVVPKSDRLDIPVEAGERYSH